jgi:uncharacterized protein YjbI with pentapeptide repeats
VVVVAGSRRVNAPRVPAKPRPPAALDRAAVEDHSIEDESTFRRIGFVDIDLSGQSGRSVEFEQCRFVHATLARVTLERADFADCRIETSDWANLRATASSLIRVECTGVRLTGLAWTDGTLRDVTFRECRMDLAGFRFTSCKDVAFIDCNLTGVDFTNADLRGTTFTGCDLTRADFAHADATGARFTRCDLADVSNVAQLKGATVSTHDLATLTHALAGALGITVDPTPFPM